MCQSGRVFAAAAPVGLRRREIEFPGPSDRRAALLAAQGRLPPPPPIQSSSCHTFSLCPESAEVRRIAVTDAPAVTAVTSTRPVTAGIPRTGLVSLQGAGAAITMRSDSPRAGATTLCLNSGGGPACMSEGRRACEPAAGLTRGIRVGIRVVFESVSESDKEYPSRQAERQVGSRQTRMADGRTRMMGGDRDRPHRYAMANGSALVLERLVREGGRERAICAGQDPRAAAPTGPRTPLRLLRPPRRQRPLGRAFPLTHPLVDSFTRPHSPLINSPPPQSTHEIFPWLAH